MSRGAGVGATGRVALVLLSALVTPLPCSAFQSAGRHELDAAPWVNDASLTLLNAGLSGLLAGTRRAVAGGEFWPAFWQGTWGGAAIYGGKRLTSAGGPGAVWTSRLVSAAGIAVVDNAAEGRGAVERLYLPLGPLAVELDLSDGLDLGLSVSTRDLFHIAEAVFDEDLSINWRSTLESGSPVFDGALGSLSRDGIDGRARGGVVAIESSNPATYRVILEHESVHVIQHEFFDRVIGNPIERWAFLRISGRDPGWLRPGFLQMGWTNLLGYAGLFDSYQHPLELEAQWIEYH